MTIRVIHVCPPVAEPCRFCIDGFEPGGIHKVLGPIYVECAACIAAATLVTCPACAGNAWFPADFDTITDLVEHCHPQGWLPVLCHGCYGVTHLIPVPGKTR